MTGPTALAPSSVAADAFRSEHDTLHAQWWDHVRYCPQYRYGRPCRVADDLAARAETAGLRWERAEREARR